MTSRAKNSPSASQWFKRLRLSFSNLFTVSDVVVLAGLCVMLLMPVLALGSAGWPLQYGVVIPVLLFSVLFGFMLARSHYNELIALLLSGVYGSAFVIFFATANESGSVFERIGSVFQRSIGWLVDAFTGGINQDALVFTMLVAVLVWFLGYSAAWHIFRIDRIWRAILPPALLLVTNSIYYAGDSDLDIYVIVFMFVALLLVVRSNLDARQWEWYVNGVRVPPRLQRQFYRVGAVFAVVALIGAWMVPSSDLQERLNDFQQFLAGEPLNDLSDLWNRLFSSGDIQGPTTADYYGGDSLQLGGAIQLGEQTVMTVSAEPGRRYYWRSRVFDTYESGRWLPAADTRLTDPQAPLQVMHEEYMAGARVAVDQVFTIGLRASRLIYSAPQVLTVDMPTRTDLRYVGYDDRFVDPNTQAGDPVKFMNVSVIRPVSVIPQGGQYSVTSLMSSATATQLRAAEAAYPQWINDLYLYVSPSVTQRTYDLAHLIVEQAGAITPYDKAKAIETWLRQNIVYNEMIPQPPVGQDPVDWVLFDLREGYCNYYASSMIMMLRVLGVPARMAAGFAQGTWDAELGQYVVEERDAHTWVEVYFPGYGWVEFEPTAAQAPLDRTDDMSVAQVPTPTPQMTFTPTATFTPSATPTEAPSATPQDPDEEGFQLPTMTPTVTLTPTIIPSATPVIVPTQPPDLQPPTPEQENLLSSLMPLLLVALAVLLILLLLVALAAFIWWWWEWRGMRGMNPIVRAYARLERYIGLIGVRLSAEQTPAERRQQIVDDLPVVEAPVSAITDLYTQQRYGPAAAQPEQAHDAEDLADDAWSETRSGILRRWLRRILMPWRR